MKMGLSPKVRSKRFNNMGQLNLELIVKDHPCELVNISETGLAFLSPDYVFEDGAEVVASVRFSPEKKIELKGKIVWRRRLDSGFLFGFHFNEGYLPEGILDALERITVFKNQVESAQNEFLAVDHKFREITYEVRYYLRNCRNYLDRLETDLGNTSETIRGSYREALMSTFESIFIERFKDFNRRLDKIYSNVTDRIIKQKYAKFFRGELADYYLNNPFGGRTAVKPRTKFNDYEKMNHINEAGYEGASLFNILMHRYGINEDSSLSVKYRKNYFINKILNLVRGAHRKDPGPLVIGALASGPAREIVELMDQLSFEEASGLSFVLIDHDTDALIHAKRTITERILKKGLSCQIYYLPVSVEDILSHSEGAEVLYALGFDLIYTAGLYDHLEQSVAKSLTNALIGMTRAKGQVIIGNFNPANPTKTIKELMADWNLIHRNDEEMMDLIDSKNNVEALLHKDELRIDTFLEIRIP